MTLANSNYEDWRLANPNEDIDNFKFSFSKMSKAGALFDMVKLADVSKNYICRLSAEEVYEMVTDWAKENNKKLYKLLVDDEEYAKAIFAIERGNAKPRKDISAWTDVEDVYKRQVIHDGVDVLSSVILESEVDEGTHLSLIHI